MRLRLRRLLDYPTARVESTDGNETRIKIEGLVCDNVCAIRTQQAFSKLPGVQAVAVDFEAGIATVEGRPQTEADYQRALDSVVAMKPLRRWLASRHGRRVGAGR